jgi:autophagy-related protein 18
MTFHWFFIISMSMLLAVSSAHDTMHIFKLGGNKGRATNGPSSSSSGSGATSPPDSVDTSREEYEGGYEGMLEKEKKKTGVS